VAAARTVALAASTLFALSLGLSPGGSPPARAQRRSDVPLADLLQIIVRPRELLAIDGSRGSQRVERLEKGESIAWHATRGRVGVVLTDRRVLAVATGSASWQEERFRSAERRPLDAALGDRIALLTTSQRAIGFDGGSGNLVTSSLGPRESVVEFATGENVGVIVTDRRALGLSPFVGGFFPVSLTPSERIEGLSTISNVATLTTSQRLLIFRSESGSWEERQLGLRD
jgi:hypothetical protein